MQITGRQYNGASVKWDDSDDEDTGIQSGQMSLTSEKTAAAAAGQFPPIFKAPEKVSRRNTTSQLPRSNSLDRLSGIQKPKKLSSRPSSPAGSPPSSPKPSGLQRRHSTSKLLDQIRPASPKMESPRRTSEFENLIPFADMPDRSLCVIRADYKMLHITGAFTNAIRSAKTKKDRIGLLEIGVMALRAKKPTEATNAIESISDETLRSVLHCEMALYYLHQGEIDKARVYISLITLPEHKAKLDAAMAVCHLQQDEVMESRRILDTLPKNVLLREWIHQKAALRLVKKEEHQEAHQHATTLIHAPAIRSNLLLDIGEFQYTQGRPDESLRLLKSPIDSSCAKRADRLRIALAKHFASKGDARRSYQSACGISNRIYRNDMLSNILTSLRKYKMYDAMYCISRTLGKQGESLCADLLRRGHVEKETDWNAKHEELFGEGNALPSIVSNAMPLLWREPPKPARASTTDSKGKTHKEKFGTDPIPAFAAQKGHIPTLDKMPLAPSPSSRSSSPLRRKGSLSKLPRISSSTNLNREKKPYLVFPDLPGRHWKIIDTIASRLLQNRAVERELGEARKIQDQSSRVATLFTIAIVAIRLRQYSQAGDFIFDPEMRARIACERVLVHVADHELDSAEKIAITRKEIKMRATAAIMVGRMQDLGEQADVSQLDDHTLKQWYYQKCAEKHAEKGEEVEALKLIEKHISDDTIQRNAYLDLAEVYLRQRKYVEVEGILTLMGDIENSKRFDAIIDSLAKNYARESKHKLSYRTAYRIANESRLAKCLYECATALYGLGKEEEAYLLYCISTTQDAQDAASALEGKFRYADDDTRDARFSELFD